MRRLGNGPALGEAHRALIADECAAQAHVAALAGKNCILGAGGAIAADEKLECWRLEAQLRPRFVDDARVNRQLSGISQLDRDGAGDGQRWTQSPDAMQFELGGARELVQIPEPRDQQKSIPQEHGHD